MFRSITAEKVVEKSGWAKNRKVDRDKIIQFFEIEGYPIFENVIEFLENFGELIIHFENKKNGIKDDDINFDFYRASHFIAPERINKYYNPRVHKKLVLIGSAYRDHFVLLMANDNSIYGGYDSFLCKIGDTPIDAVEAIILNKEFSEIE